MQGTIVKVLVEVGQTVEVAGYQIRFDGLGEYKGPNYDAVRGRFTVTRNGSPVATLRPEKRVYRSTGQPMTEAAIDRSLLRLQLLGALNWTRTWYRPGKRGAADIARHLVMVLRSALG